VTSPRTFTWLVTVMGLAALGLLMSLTGAAQPLQSAAQRASTPIAAVISSTTRPVTDFIANVGSYGRLRDENRALRTDNERLRTLLAQAGEADVLNQNLADLSAANLGQVTIATIVARDPSPSRDVVAINRGTSDGVQKGMPVLGKGGALVGTVQTAHASVAWVRLLSDRQSSVNAMIQETRARALVSGSTDRDLRMEIEAQGTDVKPGDAVVTSGLGGGYPPGLLIGRVAKVDGGPLDIFRTVEVEAAVRLSSLETVAVMTSFRPAPIEELGQ
jgi:rod shape-determining protein MreC